MQTNLNGRIALIVGAADEIGTEIARDLSAHAATVVLCDSSRQRLDAVVGGMCSDGREAMAVELAAPNVQAIASTVSQVSNRFGRIDILVNNCPELSSKALGDISADDLTCSLSTTLGTPLHFLRESVAVMRKAGYGRIVNLINLAYLGMDQQLNVAVAQGGVFGLTRSAALEVAKDNITVNTIVKGDVASETMAEEEKAKLINPIPVKRLGTPADIAGAVRFFAHDASKYVTGQTLFVCGGKSLHFSMSV